MAVDIGELADERHPTCVAKQVGRDDPGDLAKVVDTQAEVSHDAGEDGDHDDLVVGGDENAEAGGEDGDVGGAGADHGVVGLDNSQSGIKLGCLFIPS